MPVDASIYGQIQQPKVTSPMDALLHAYQLQDAQLGSQQKQQAFSDEQAYRQAAKQSGGDMNALYKLLSTSNPTKALELQKKMLEQQKTQADVSHLGAQSGKLLSETDALKMAQHRDQLTNVNTPEDALAWAQQGVSQGIMKPEQYQMAQASIQQAAQSPQAFQDWKQKNALGMTKFIELNKPTVHVQNLGGTSQVVSTPGLGGAANVLSNTPITESANNIANNERIAREGRLNRGQAESHFQAGMNAPQYMETDAGLVALPKKLGAGQAPTGTLVTGPDGQQLGKPLKPIPASVNSAIITNNQSKNQLERALTLLEGKDIAGMQGDKNATGWKGYLGQSILNRIDPQGVNTRAEIADIGSMKIHDRSGAAVTISEAPRLMPFIPQATDDAPTAAKKLKRLLLEINNESKALTDIYSKEQGYKPPPALPGNPRPAAPNPGLPDASAIDAEIARRRGK